MRKSGQKNTVNVTAAQLSKLNPNAKVAVSSSWLKRYNEFADTIGAEQLIAEDESEAPTVEVGAKSGLCNVEVG
jgi:hypothetical protein